MEQNAEDGYKDQSYFKPVVDYKFVKFWDTVGDSV